MYYAHHTIMVGIYNLDTIDMSDFDSLILEKVSASIDKAVALKTSVNLSPARDPNVDVLTRMKDICEYLNMSRNTFVKAYCEGYFGPAAWKILSQYYFRKSLFGKN